LYLHLNFVILSLLLNVKMVNFQNFSLLKWTKVDIHDRCSLFLPTFNENWNMLRDIIKILLFQITCKFFCCYWTVAWRHEVRQAERKQTRHANICANLLRVQNSYKVEADNTDCPSLKDQNVLFRFNTITGTNAYILNCNDSNGSTCD
jgi:hypothetical protein